jgi:hypothetical protein
VFGAGGLVWVAFTLWDSFVKGRYCEEEDVSVDDVGGGE